MSEESPGGSSVLRSDRTDQVCAVLWLLVGAVILFQSRELEYMEEYGPGPGFLPFWLGVLFTVLAGVLLARATLFANKTEVIELPSLRATQQLLLVIAAIAAFILLAETVGFIPCIGLMFLFMLAFVERRGWKFALAMGIGSALVFWVIFEWGLELRLPPGVLDLVKG